MIIKEYQFKPRWWILVLSVALIIVFTRLGLWQLSRADEKDSKQQLLDQLAHEAVLTLPSSRIELSDLLFRNVEVKGQFIASQTIFLDNKIYRGAIGYHVLTPMRIENSGMHVLINRGWVALGKNRSTLPEIFTPTDIVTISGIVLSPTIRTMKISDEISIGKVWIALDFEKYQAVSRLELQPVLLVQLDNSVNDGLKRELERQDLGASKNMSYAFQWFFLAITVLILLLALNVKRSSPQQ
ncbi:MAG: SURF1 family protein [Nitrosomonas sp.]|jgi:surfeit locus 1 family protein|nr:SURF1 family protein [Nitrosomonas sp.]MBK7364410.1 SURF1 family protein [Nitrosomonas sp.]